MPKRSSILPSPTSHGAASFLHRALVQVLGWTSLLVSISFFTATYDTAQVKLTLLHVGATSLLALWGALKIAERKSPFTRQNILFLLPLLAYVGWNILSFIFAPYKMEAAEEFVRTLLYGGITLLVATELTQTDIKTLTKFILAAAWISLLYGTLQIVDGFLPGADFMPWRGFFTKRIFSTHANPNFFGAFVVFISALAGSWYFISRKKSMFALLALGLACLWFTESKGAWVAYAAAGAFAVLLYTNFLAPRLSKAKIKFLNLGAAVLLIVALALAGIYTHKRFQSVSFRTYTWLSSFEMFQDSPLLGTGPGSFKIIYPAYRRPQIFYIENSHNTETQHAENEYLEQGATLGLVGLSLYLWLLIFTLICAVKNLQKGDKLSATQRERNYLLWGYASALVGLLVHAGVDISVRFASSGLFLAIFIGVLLALSRPQEEEQTTKPLPKNFSWIAMGLYGLLAIGVLGAAGWIIMQFHEVTAVLATTSLGEGVLLAASWTVCIFCVSGIAFVYLKSAFKLRNALASLVLLLSLPLLVGFYGFFQANHYYSLGVSLLSHGSPDGAIGYFTQAVRLNPFLTEYRQYRANVLASTLNLTQTFSRAKGDNKALSNDYERALNDFSTVLNRAPNHSLLHQNLGQLYYAMALKQSQASAQAKSAQEYNLYAQNARENMAQAKQALERSLLIDPVNEATYFMLINIALLERNAPRAEYWLNTYRQGPAGVTEEEFLTKNRTNPHFLAAEEQIKRLRSSDGK